MHIDEITLFEKQFQQRTFKGLEGISESEVQTQNFGVRLSAL